MDTPNQQNIPSTDEDEEPIPPQMARVGAVIERCLANVLPYYIERHEAKYGRDPAGPQDKETEANDGR